MENFSNLGKVEMQADSRDKIVAIVITRINVNKE